MKTILIYAPQGNVSDGDKVRLVRRMKRGADIIGYGFQVEIDPEKLTQHARRLLKFMKNDLSGMITDDDLYPVLVERIRFPSLRKAAEILDFPEECVEYWDRAYEDADKCPVEHGQVLHAYNFHGWWLEGRLEQGINFLAERRSLYIRYAHQYIPLHETPCESEGSAHVWEHMLRQAKAQLALRTA